MVHSITIYRVQNCSKPKKATSHSLWCLLRQTTCSNAITARVPTLQCLRTCSDDKLESQKDFFYMCKLQKSGEIETRRPNKGYCSSLLFVVLFICAYRGTCVVCTILLWPAFLKECALQCNKHLNVLFLGCSFQG